MEILCLLLIVALAWGGFLTYRAWRGKPKPAVVHQAGPVPQYKSPGFEIISRTGPVQAPPAPQAVNPSHYDWTLPQQAGGADFAVTEVVVNPKARCLLTGMEVGTCTCQRHKKK